MKFIVSVTTLSILVASTSATSLRSTESSDRELLMASSGMAAPAALSVDSTSSNELKKQGRQNVKRGSPSVLEFVPGGCIGFEQEKIGQKVKVVDCNDAPEFVYRNDYLLELYNTDYCLEASNDRIVLRNCDNDYEEQQWFFTATVNKNKRVYRVFNYYTQYFAERVTTKVTLQGKDKNDQDQLLVELDRNFFDAN